MLELNHEIGATSEAIEINDQRMRTCLSSIFLKCMHFLITMVYIVQSARLHSFLSACSYVCFGSTMARDSCIRLPSLPTQCVCEMLITISSEPATFVQRLPNVFQTSSDVCTTTTQSVANYPTSSKRPWCLKHVG